MNLKQIPKGYTSVSNYNTRRCGTIIQWFPELGEGYVFCNIAVYHKSFRIPFALEQIAEPDPRAQNLSSFVKKGMGIEFNLIVKEYRPFPSLDYNITNDDLMVWNCKLIATISKHKSDSVTTNPFASIYDDSWEAIYADWPRGRSRKFINSFLIRRKELRD